VVPDLSKTSMCRMIMDSGVCSSGSSCKFAHGPEDLRSTEGFFRCGLCFFHFRHSSGCTQGKGCRHAHSVDELRVRRQQSSRRGGQAQARPSPPAGPPPPDAPQWPPGSPQVWSWGPPGRAPMPGLPELPPESLQQWANYLSDGRPGGWHGGGPAECWRSPPEQAQLSPPKPAPKALKAKGKTASPKSMAGSSPKAGAKAAAAPIPCPVPGKETDQLVAEIREYLEKQDEHSACMAAVGGVFHVRKAFVQRFFRVVDRMVYLDEEAVALATAKGVLGALPVGKSSKSRQPCEGGGDPHNVVDVAGWLRMMGLGSSAPSASPDGSSFNANGELVPVVNGGPEADVDWTVQRLNEPHVHVKNTFISFEAHEADHGTGEMKRAALSVPVDMFKMCTPTASGRSEQSSPNLSRSSSAGMEGDSPMCQ